jgi:hypothetical protein
MAKKKKSAEEEQAEALAELRALPKPAMDFTTPEGAILCLEDAYRRRDIEAAVACKDFLIEATLMLAEVSPGTADDPEVQGHAANVLELAFRKEKTSAWPDMEGIESFFIERQPFSDGIVVVQEFMRMPDGTFCEAKLRVAHTQNGWRVLDPLLDDADDADESDE